MVIATLVLASSLRFFGSAGVESQLTPANERSPLNPGNIAAIPQQTNVADFNMTVEAILGGRPSRPPVEGERDARPPWKLRMKLRGDASDRAADHMSVGEAYVQVRPAKWLDLTAGRVIEKWGTGYGWTPTAFVGPAKDPTDPNDRRSQYAGRDMIRADFFVKETSLSLYALEGGDVAARVYRLIGNTDVSLVAHRGDAGISLSRVVGDALELHAEASTSHVVAGGQYTIRDTNIVFEISHDTDGLTQSEWDAFTESVPDDLLRANQTFAPLRMARTYSFIRVARGRAELIAITNLRDGSTLLRATLTHELRPSLSIYAIATEFLGGGELSYIQVERVVTVGARVHF